jgi:MFS family permease
MDERREQKEQKFLLATAFVGHLTNDWVAGTIWLIAPAVAAGMGLGPAEVGLLLAVNGFGAALGYIPAGIAADRFAHQGRLLVITFWWVALGYFGASLVPGFWPITLLFAFGAMGDAFWHPVATGILVKRMPGKKARVLGIHAMGGSIGAEVLGPLSAGFLLGYFDWRTSMQILIIPAVVMGIVFIPLSRRIGTITQRQISRIDLNNLVRHWSTPGGLGLIAMMVSYNMALFAMLSMTPLFLQNRHGLDPAESGMVFAALLLIGTFFQPIAGHVSDRRGRKRMILITFFFAGLLSAGAGLSSGFPAYVTMLAVSVTLLTAVRPVVLAAAVEFSGKSEATTLGIVFAVLDGVGALGALLAGYAGEIDLSWAYVLAGGLAMLAAAQTALISFAPHHQGNAVTES